MKGATAAQQAQLKMIKNVFSAMDADKDGLLSVGDVRAYFRAIGRNASDGVVRRWITARDVDQDGAVSLPEFVASFAMQLDPSSRAAEGAKGVPIPSAPEVSPVTVAFGAVQLGNSPTEVLEACSAVEEYVHRILDAPTVQSFWRIFVSDAAFQRRIGRLFSGTKLMYAMGFEAEDNGGVVALRDPNGKRWDTVPQDVRTMLSARLEELQNHKQALLEPSVSNIAAVSTAIGRLGDSLGSCTAWSQAIETLLLIVNNVIAHPGEAKYYRINTANPNFHRRYADISTFLFKVFILNSMHLSVWSKTE
jgi:hypothetical protein